MAHSCHMQAQVMMRTTVSSGQTAQNLMVKASLVIQTEKRMHPSSKWRWKHFFTTVALL